MSPLLIAILVAVVVFTAYVAIDTYFSRQQRLNQLQGAEELPDEYYTPEGQDALVEITDQPSSAAKGVENFLRLTALNVEQAKKELRPKLMHAGLNSPDTPAYILLYRRLIGFFVAALGIPLLLTKDPTSLQYAYWIGGALFVVLGLFGSQLYISNTTQRRQQNLQRAFPDTLDLMVVCVESGLALDAALARVTNELGRAYPEINEELNRTRLELTLLNDRSRALINLGERTNLVAFRSLVAALIQTERFGTSLTDTLRVLSDDYRHTRLMIAENKAGRLPALMTVPLITLLLPALFIIIMGPAYITVKLQGGLFGGG
jgi:tight adherence protein C